MSKKRMKGFGLIEILVTLGVLTVGILGVTTLHSVITQQSIQNKTKTEALLIAESRIEVMRNFTGAVSSEDAFDTFYADTNGYGNSTSITGVSAVYTRSESITTDGNLKDVVVQVAWTDPDGEAQTVSLSTQLSYLAPRSAGDSALESAEQLVDAPTGRARLGEGTLPDDAVTTSNGDGTSLYNDGGTELMLVSDDQIVLTLAQACQTSDGTCIDFVKIRGRIYIDTASQNQLDPGDVQVLASDAAFCARHFTSNGTTIVVTNDTTTALSTATGSYEYFDYTCYIGGGWHGNIGILLAGGNTSQDKICVGDPVTTITGDMPVIAARRVYRGMLYKYDDAGMDFLEDDGGTTRVETVTGNTSLPRYYSQGIADEAELPDPSDSSQHSHDFVVGKMSASLTDGSNCETQGIMTRTDATVNGVTGGLFANLPGDFICLNDGYMDHYDVDTYGNRAACPYDPSDPPSDRHLISGVLRLTTTESSANAALAAAMYTQTSDGSGNCRITSASTWNTSYYQSGYECDVYDWGNGWNGFVLAKYDRSSISCTTSQFNYSALTGDDSSGNDFNSCATGTYAVFSGTVSASGSRNLSTAAMSNGGACTVATNGLSYQCISALLPPGVTWTGSLAFGITSGFMCGGTTYSYSNQSGGNYTRNLVIATNSLGC